VPHLLRFGDGEAVQQDVGRCEDDVEKGARDGPRPLHKANARARQGYQFGSIDLGGGARLPRSLHYATRRTHTVRKKSRAAPVGMTEKREAAT